MALDPKNSSSEKQHNPRSQASKHEAWASSSPELIADLEEEVAQASVMAGVSTDPRFRGPGDGGPCCGVEFW